MAKGELRLLAVLLDGKAGRLFNASSSSRWGRYRNSWVVDVLFGLPTGFHCRDGVGFVCNCWRYLKFHRSLIFAGSLSNTMGPSQPRRGLLGTILLEAYRPSQTLR